jgi:hypothetical protein
MDLSYLHPVKLRKLNQSCIRYTFFQTFEQLIDKKNNYNPIFYRDQNVPEFEVLDLAELKEEYNICMKHNNDPRRVIAF